MDEIKNVQLITFSPLENDDSFFLLNFIHDQMLHRVIWQENKSVMPWENVPENNIKQCFKHVGFSKENWEYLGTDENEKLYEAES